MHFINGVWEAGNGEVFLSYNPTNNTPVWEGTIATEQESAKAYEAAQTAQTKWALLDLNQRVQFLKKFASNVEENRKELANTISLETGKPLWESITEVNSVISKISISLDAFHARTFESQVQVPDAKGFVRFKPHGVVAVLGPFNFPAHLSNGHIVPALLAGNTVIYKPSELTPLVAELIIECWENTGIPPGVINCIQGTSTTAKSLLSQPIRGVFFTGSYTTGLSIQDQFKQKPEVILALEMGGNSPLVIDKMQNTNAAIYHSILSIFITAGQRCTCARRLIIPDNSFGDAFLKQFIQNVNGLKIGDFQEQPEPFMGPVIGHQQALAFLKAQADLQLLGGDPLLKMRLLKENSGFLSPGIMDMSKAKKPKDEEIFAPFVQIYRYQNFDEAIELANDTSYGLAAGLLSDNRSHYEKFYTQVNAGVINWNRPTTGAASNLPFGGIGRSGNHRPSAYFAADYCSYPIASLEQSELTLPEKLLPGVALL